MHLGPLEEVAGGDLGAEFRLADEVVFAPLLPGRAARAWCARSTPRAAIELEQRLDEAGLAGAAGRGDDEQVAGVWSAGFIRGSAPARAAVRSARDLHLHRDVGELQRRRLEASVLASRCSSWMRKSSRLPTSPPAPSSRSISSRWAPGGQFLGHVDADGEGRGLVDRAFLQRFARHAGRGVDHGQRFPPALQEALLLALHDGGHQRLGLRRQFAQAPHAFHQDGDEAGAGLARPRHRAGRRCSAGCLERGLVDLARPCRCGTTAGSR